MRLLSHVHVRRGLSLSHRLDAERRRGGSTQSFARAIGCEIISASSQGAGRTPGDLGSSPGWRLAAHAGHFFVLFGRRRQNLIITCRGDRPPPPLRLMPGVVYKGPANTTLAGQRRLPTWAAPSDGVHRCRRTTVQGLTHTPSCSISECRHTLPAAISRAVFRVLSSTSFGLRVGWALPVSTYTKTLRTGEPSAQRFDIERHGKLLRG